MERSRGEGILHRRRDSHERNDPSLLWLFTPSSGLHPERRNRVRRFLAPRRWRSAIVLEEQSLSDKRIHGRGRFSASAMGGDRSRQERRHQRDSHRLGRAPRSSLRSAVLAWRRRCDGWPGPGAWKPFASGTVADGSGGTATLRLDSSPVTTKYVRVWMTRSSNTCDTHGSSDRRNCAGYAIRELYLGTIDENNEFKDHLHHSPDQKQTLSLCSSVDPWHEPSDLYLAPDRMESGDQPGFDLFFNSGITRG